MAHLPLPTSSVSPTAPALPPVCEDSSADGTDTAPANLVSTLRHALAEGSHQPQAIYRATVDSARIMTGADGVALAMTEGEVVLCKAASGRLAPPLGSVVDVSSGISGACFRSGKSLICDDTQSDDRVDPELCRKLDIRSIAVVPVRRLNRIVGILESFSDRSHAFDAEGLACLEQLAEIAAAAGMGANSELTPASARNLPPPGAALIHVPRKSIDLIEARRNQIRRELLAAATLESAPIEKTRARDSRPWMIGGIGIIVVLMSIVAWLSWHGSDDDLADVQPSSHVKVQKQQPSEPALETIPKPSAALPVMPIRKSQADALLQNAARLEKAPIQLLGNGTTAAAEQTATQLSPLKESRPQNDSVAPPVVADLQPSSRGLKGIVAASPALPSLDIKISQGVTEGKLIHEVPPVYPVLARSERLTGSVLLDASIGEDGRVRTLKAVSGAPVLVSAAIDAVKQWRYSPSLLNGKPVTVEREITIIFKAPQ